MNPMFVVLAGVMIAAAVGFVALPLMRVRRGTGSIASKQRSALDSARDAGVITDDEYARKLAEIERLAHAHDAAQVATRERRPIAVVATIALLLPASAIGLYLAVGEPRALDPTALVAAVPPSGNGPEMDEAIGKLAARLKQAPDDVAGWMLLGRALKTTQRFAESRDAIAQAYEREPNNPDVMVEYAEAIALATDTRRLDGRSRELLETAITAQPDHQHALWLLGFSDYQAGDYAAAIARWEALQSQLPADAPMRATLQERIDDAREKGGVAPTSASAAGAPAAAPPTSAPSSSDAGAPASTAPIRLTAEVSLDPKFVATAPRDASVFVYAKAASGPPMPLAVQRLTVADLPAKVVLTEDMGMLPNLKLSMFPQVIVGARVSRTGNAIAQSGDLQTQSAPIDVRSTDPIKLTIDTVKP